MDAQAPTYDAGWPVGRVAGCRVPQVTVYGPVASRKGSFVEFQKMQQLVRTYQALLAALGASTLSIQEKVALLERQHMQIKITAGISALEYPLRKHLQFITGEKNGRHSY